MYNGYDSKAKNVAETWFWSIVAMVVIICIALACGRLISLAAEPLAKVGAALLGALGALLLAFLKFGFDLHKQRQNSIYQRNRELESASHLAMQQQRHTDYLAKQRNYELLLSKVAAFAHNSAEASQLSSAHLASWAFGDLEVMIKTNEFQKSPTEQSLMSLLKSVRRSLENSRAEYEPSRYGYTDGSSKAAPTIDELEKIYDASVLFPEHTRGLKKS
jgi:hypothetical protein